jgi:hypothetical protein
MVAERSAPAHVPSGAGGPRPLDEDGAPRLADIAVDAVAGAGPAAARRLGAPRAAARGARPGPAAAGLLVEMADCLAGGGGAAEGGPGARRPARLPPLAADVRAALVAGVSGVAGVLSDEGDGEVVAAVLKRLGA